MPPQGPLVKGRARLSNFAITFGGSVGVGQKSVEVCDKLGPTLSNCKIRLVVLKLNFKPVIAPDDRRPVDIQIVSSLGQFAVIVSQNPADNLPQQFLRQLFVENVGHAEPRSSSTSRDASM